MAAPKAQQVAGHPDLYWTGAALQPQQHAVSQTLLDRLESLAKATGKKLYIFSGYRSSSYSAAHGGFSGDPHTQHIATDVTTAGGTPIGQAIPVQTIQAYGLRSGNVPDFYQGKPDPSHVDLVGVGAPSAGKTFGANTQGISQWEQGFLTAIAAPVTTANVKFLRLWAKLEGVKSSAKNPLATTQDAKGATNYNSVGVKNYPDLQTSVAATAATIKNGRYPAILSALRSGDPSKYLKQDHNAQKNALSEASTWGTGAQLIIGAVEGNYSSGGGGILAGLGSAGNAVAGAEQTTAQAIAAPFAAIGDFFSWISNGENIRRIGMVLLGAVMFILGAYLLAKQEGAI